MAASYTVNITLTDNSDPNGPNHFNYAPAYLVVHVGDQVRFNCNRAFKVKFPYESPFGATTEFSKDGPGTTGYAPVPTGTVHQLYHYVVTAVGPNNIPYVDAACPTVEVG